MVKTTIPIYLASKSPRRAKLLKLLNLEFKTFSVDLNEYPINGESPIAMVKRLASHKMDAALQKVKEGIVITADTIVVLDKKIIGKPVNQKDAFRILKMLSGRTHNVYTGFGLVNTKKKIKIIDYERTAVTFRELSDIEIKDYIKTGSPMDKAGAYGIQDDFGAVFVKKISGCYYNVVGLPLSKLYKSIKEVV